MSRIFQQIGEYLGPLKQQEPKKEPDMLQMMHRINRSSIFLFLLALLVLVIRTVIRNW